VRSRRLFDQHLLLILVVTALTKAVACASLNPLITIDEGNQAFIADSDDDVPIPTTAIDVSAGPGPSVILVWDPDSTLTVRIVRRDLLSAREASVLIAIVDPAARGRHVDRTVAPGGVYAYRVEFIAPSGIMAEPIASSEEVYVTLDP
jgi:hypothetical protein